MRDEDVDNLDNDVDLFEDADNFLEEDANGEEQLWEKRSIFFYLPYWQFNLLRHNLDVMHIEKNIYDNLLATLLNVDGKSKDNEEAGKDLAEMDLRHKLHLINRPNKKSYMPPAKYNLSSSERTSFL